MNLCVHDQRSGAFVDVRDVPFLKQEQKLQGLLNQVNGERNGELINCTRAITLVEDQVFADELWEGWTIRTHLFGNVTQPFVERKLPIVDFVQDQAETLALASGGSHHWLTIRGPNQHVFVIDVSPDSAPVTFRPNGNAISDPVLGVNNYFKRVNPDYAWSPIPVDDALLCYTA